MKDLSLYRNQTEKDMNKLSEMIELLRKVKMDEKKKEIEYYLIKIFIGIGIDRPSNFQAILDFVFDDVNTSADEENWHDGDVAIAFRRWIEEQEHKGYICSAI
jgi:hypothetical protein